MQKVDLFHLPLSHKSSHTVPSLVLLWPSSSWGSSELGTGWDPTSRGTGGGRWLQRQARRGWLGQASLRKCLFVLSLHYSHIWSLFSKLLFCLGALHHQLCNGNNIPKNTDADRHTRTPGWRQAQDLAPSRDAQVGAAPTPAIASALRQAATSTSPVGM